MSSDIMIVCKEFNNYYSGKDLMNDKSEPTEPAVCIGEASMGDPGDENQFANWFISRYYSGMTMLEQVAAPQIDQKLKQDMTFQHEVFNETDVAACQYALENMSCPYLGDKNGKADVLHYLKKCVGNHVSTENW